MTTVDDADTTVLVVDDDEHEVELYARWLEGRYTVETATGGRAGLEAIDCDVDIVLLDRRMPGLDGETVLERIRDRGLDCRVVMVTAMDPDLDIIDMPFDDYLVKPVTETELYETIERVRRLDVYDERMCEYFTLVSKKAALETELDDRALTESEEYAALESRIEACRRELDRLVVDFTARDVSSVLRAVGD